MQNFIYKTLENTEENAIKMEKIRYQVYNITDNVDVRKSYYADIIKRGNILVFTCEYESKLVAACYISNSFDSLYVEYLFVLPEYQEKGLHIGKKLLQYICDNKELVEKYFNQKFSYSLLSPTTEKSRAIYESMGYKTKNKVFNIMRKNL